MDDRYLTPSRVHQWKRRGKSELIAPYLLRSIHKNHMKNSLTLTEFIIERVFLLPNRNFNERYSNKLIVKLAENNPPEVITQWTNFLHSMKTYFNDASNDRTVASKWAGNLILTNLIDDQLRNGTYPALHKIKELHRRYKFPKHPRMFPKTPVGGYYY